MDSAPGCERPRDARSSAVNAAVVPRGGSTDGARRARSDAERRCVQPDRQTRVESRRRATTDRRSAVRTSARLTGACEPNSVSSVPGVRWTAGGIEGERMTRSFRLVLASCGLLTMPFAAGCDVWQCWGLVDFF